MLAVKKSSSNCQTAHFSLRLYRDEKKEMQVTIVVLGLGSLKELRRKTNE